MATPELRPQRLEVNGREIEYPPASPTLGEMADAENFFGVEWNRPERSGARLVLAMLWIAIKRVDATVTVDDVRALDPEILNQLAGDAGPPPPSTSADRPPVSSVTSGPGSSNGGEDPASDQSSTGSRGLGTGSTSDPVTSAT